MAEVAFSESVDHPCCVALAENSLFSPYNIHRNSSLPLHESDTEVDILVGFLKACQGTRRQKEAAFPVGLRMSQEGGRWTVKGR